MPPDATYTPADPSVLILTASPQCNPTPPTPLMALNAPNGPNASLHPLHP